MRPPEENPESQAPTTGDGKPPKPGVKEREPYPDSGSEPANPEKQDDESEPWREEVTKWVSTTVGLISAVVGTITVLNEKFVLPFVDPISIKMELQFDTRSDKATEGENSIVILKAMAKNESDRRKWLLKPHWILYGYTSQPKSTSSENVSGSNGAPSGFIIPSILFQTLNTALQYSNTSASSVELTGNAYDGLDAPMLGSAKRFLGMGQLFPVDEMHRGQEIKVQKVIRIPKVPRLQYIEAVVNLPTLNDSHVIDTRQEIRWGGCLSRHDDPFTCLDREDEAKPVVSADQSVYRLVNWRNFFCEDLPLSKNYRLSPYQVIGIFATNRYFKQPESPNNDADHTSTTKVKKTAEDRFCGGNTLGLTSEERAAVGAQIQSFTNSFLVSGEKP